jgi:hypothetical protein
VAANGAGGVIRGKKEDLKAGEDNDEISDADVHTSSAFKIEMAHPFVGGDGRIIQIFFPLFFSISPFITLLFIYWAVYFYWRFEFSLLTWWVCILDEWNAFIKSLLYKSHLLFLYTACNFSSISSIK